MFHRHDEPSTAELSMRHDPTMQRNDPHSGLSLSNPERGVTSDSEASLAAIGDDLHRLSCRFRRLLQRISRTEELADAIGLELVGLEESLAQLLRSASTGGGRSTTVTPNPRSRTHEPREPTTFSRGAATATERLLRSAAERGAGSLELDRRADGSAVVTVDQGAPFKLPPMLADLLDVLALDNGQARDGLVGWKTLAEVAVLLTKRVGRRVSKRAVTQGVYRLRRRLFEEGGVNPHLVQSNRRYGLRFALRTKDSAGIGPAAGWGKQPAGREGGR